MKYIKIFFSGLLFASIIASGCNKKLDVEPQQNITPDQITNEGDLLAVLYGTYSLLQDADAFGEQFILISDLLASGQHTVWQGTFTTYEDLFRKQQISSNLVAETMWTNAYSIINTLNTVLSKTELVNEDDREAVIAEAKFLRGLVYFELVNYYALPYSAGSTNTNLGVPLMLEPVFAYEPSRDDKPRATVEAVYNQIISDLTEGAANMPEETSNGRATRWAAYAILSRVYLNQANYEQAATAANEVIGFYGDLTLDYSDVFNNDGPNSGEDIFSILQTSQSNAGTSNVGLTTFYLAYDSDDPTIAGGGRGNVQVDETYLDIFEPGDVRGEFTYTGANISGEAGRFAKKWSAFYRNIPVVRLAEMYLTRGEANLRKGGTPVGGVDPIDDLNKVRLRSLASPITDPADVTGDLFVDERFRELGFEGDRLWTLKRLKLDVDGLPYTHPKLILPIPRREREINTKLDQNAGYQ